MMRVVYWMQLGQLGEEVVSGASIFILDVYDYLLIY